jgi:hypothetical protein
MRIARSLARFLAAGMFSMAHVPAGYACGYDGLIGELSAAHPGSLSVAFALHDALARDELKALAPMPPLFGLMRANRMANDFGEQVKQMTGGVGSSASVLLIESGLWTRFTFRAGGVVVEPHVAGPKDGEAVIITSEAALNAILDGRLSIEQGLEKGLLKVIAPQRAHAGRSL